MGAFNKVFTGVTTADMRRYTREFLSFLRSERKVDKVVIPCVGEFSLVDVAIAAGFEKQNILCSDISLYSSVIGYFVTEQPLDYLDIELFGEYAMKYANCTTELDKAALVLFCIKLGQFNDSKAYERDYIHEMETNMDKYLDTFKNWLLKKAETYKGIKYEVKDVRSLCHANGDESMVMLLDLPYGEKFYNNLSSNRYVHMEKCCSEFNIRKELSLLYWDMRDTTKMHSLWLCDRVNEDLPESDIAAYYEQKVGVGTPIYIVRLNDYAFDEKWFVKTKAGGKNVVRLPILEEEHIYSVDDIVTVKEVNRDTALYYRDLFAHRLGATAAETYIAIFINGKLKGISGFNTSFIRRMETTYIFENFCFPAPSIPYENTNRLDMLILLSGEFKDWFMRTVLKSSAYVELKSFRTVCLSKYRKMKVNTGLLAVESTEKLPNGTYKIMYDQEFYTDRTFKDVLRIYLEQDVKIKKDKKNGLMLSGLAGLSMKDFKKQEE